MTTLEAALAKYGWIGIGLTFGFAAKYALLIKRGVRVRTWLVVADVMLLPIIALIAFWLCEALGLRGEGAAIATALSTVSADRLLRLATERFMRRAEAIADILIPPLPGQAPKTD
ncbi:MAG: hypothetical protein BGN95_03865 [Sphingomonas sp. 66-10]|uniref:hypothetical protein n=1 Tax=Sphingomonas sp. 66-10 TaxID=1895848 RepID=UPI00092B185A|nr:hypothetical protein [Sphingomonas sp. 66-10]OJU22713.1 MAG: hypothetical protein BGN95_03865 [Sphingomonas sp. 66-10]